MTTEPTPIAEVTQGLACTLCGQSFLPNHGLNGTCSMFLPSDQPGSLASLTIALADAERKLEEARRDGDALHDELEKSMSAHRRLINAVLDAIDTGRSEPLFIVRDQLRNYLAAQDGDHK